MDEQCVKKLSSYSQHESGSEISESELEKSIQEVIAILDRTGARILNFPLADGRNLLDALDPYSNSIPFLYVILAQGSYVQASGAGISQKTSHETLFIEPGTSLWAKALDFFHAFEARQVLYAGNIFRRLVDCLAFSARSVQKPILAVAPIRSAILRLDPSSATFTSTHTLFVRLCLEANAFKEALPVLEKDVVGFPTLPAGFSLETGSRSSRPGAHNLTDASQISENLSPTHVLEYYIFGAMIYIGLKHWARALDFLALVIASPTEHVANAIMVEAYKKWILVCLIHHEQLLPIPSSANPSAIKAYHSLAKPYDRIAGVFRPFLLGDFLQEVESGRDIWQQDNNAGLVDLVAKTLRDFSIRSLESVYSALPVLEIHRRLYRDKHHRVEDTEAHIVSLIKDNRLRAYLEPPSQSDGGARDSATLHFIPLSIPEAVQIEQLQARIRHIHKLTDQIHSVDRSITSSKDYLSAVARQRAGKGRGGELDRDGPIDADGTKTSSSQPTEGMDLDWGNGPVTFEDEDVMADM